MRIKSAVVLVASVLAVSAAAQPTPAPTPSPQVRMRWQDFVVGPDGAKRLARLEAAVAKMKSLDQSPRDSPDFRRSWAYWANIHGYYGPQSPDGTVEAQVDYLKQQGMGEYASYYEGMADQTPPDAVARQIWATCQHSSSDQQAPNFFGWHRMYLYYYERVLRWAAGDDTLRLPYWDYTNPAQVALPADFRSKPASLYDWRRDAGMNAGTHTLDPSSTDVDDLLPVTDYFSYESQIEQGVHGYVHCTTGPTCPVADMGDVPVAGNDPVFYSHHANIDRLWACWQHLHETPPGDWQTQQFTFVDETGTPRTRPVKDFLDTAALGYVYDNATQCSRTAAGRLAAPAPEGRPARMIGSAKETAIRSALTSVDLDAAQPPLREALEHVERPGAMELVLRDVTAESHPGVLFDVYLARKGEPDSRQHVGTISWFGAFRHHGRSGPAKRTLRYDVTDELRALDGTKAAGSGLTVIIEASHGRRATDAGQAGALRQAAAVRFRPAANLTIGAIELNAKPQPK